jgi:hypothetical protein
MRLVFHWGIIGLVVFAALPRRRTGEVIQRIRALFKGGALETTALDLNDVIGEVLKLLGNEITRNFSANC